MCQSTDDYVIVYQAYNDAIGKYAAKNKKFEGAPGWLPRRMTWFKTDFLWMMYRCNYARSANQTTVLAIKVRTADFWRLLSICVPSSYAQSAAASQAEYKRELAGSDVRLQWDPAHSPGGAKLRRRAIQIGMRNDHAVQWASGSMFVDVIDITEFVIAQRDATHEQLMLPRERVLTPSDPAIIARLRISADFDAVKARKANRDDNDNDDGDDDDGSGRESD